MPQIEYQNQFLSVLTHISSSVRFLQTHQFQLAEKQTLKALELEPEYSLSLYLYSLCLDKKGKTESATIFKQQSYYYNALFFQHFNFKEQDILKSIQRKSSQLINKIKKGSVTSSECQKIIQQTSDYDTFAKMAKICLQGTNQKGSRAGKMLFILRLAQAGQAEIVYNQIHNRHKGLQNILPMPQQLIISITFDLAKYNQCFQAINKYQQKSPDSIKPFVMRSKIFYKLNKSKQALKALELEGGKSRENMYYVLQAIIVLLRFFPEEKDQIQKYLEKGKQIHEVHWIRENLIVKWLQKHFECMSSSNGDWIEILNKVSDTIFAEKCKKEKLYIGIQILAKKLGLQPLRISVQFIGRSKPRQEVELDSQFSQVSSISGIGSYFDEDSLVDNDS